MEKKKASKKWIFPVCAALAALLLAALPFLIGSGGEAAAQASILHATVERGDISETVSGAGMLTEQEAVEVTVPDGVRIKAFLVSNEDRVAQGDALVSVDRVTVMQAISSLQETLDALSEQIEDAAGESAENSITAPAAGRVMAVYAQAGERVQDVMLTNGALALLSLDGLLAVDLRSETVVTVGESVTVTLSDGTQVPGQVEKALNGAVTVTLSDEGPGLGEAVRVTTADGRSLGSGELYIHSQWQAEGFTGEVTVVNVRAGDKVTEGKTLFRLADTDYSGRYAMLAAQRREYEELMLELFLLYQDEVIKAPCDGVVSGIDKNSPLLLAAESGGFHVMLLRNEPNGDSDTGYRNRIGMVTELYSDGSYAIRFQENDIEVTDYLNIPYETLSEESMIMTGSVQPGVAPVYDCADGWPVHGNVQAGDVLLFTYDENSVVWMIYLGHNDMTQEPSPGNSGGAQLPGGGQLQVQLPTGSFSFGTGGGTVQEEQTVLFNLEGTRILSVTPQETMTVTLSIDELDILSLSVGQQAEITIDALPGQRFEGTVTRIDASGQSSGGNSKYAVELSLPRGENMLGGMNAKAVIAVSVRQNVLCVPAAALAEEGAKTLVYLGYDEAARQLTDPIEVETGLSDGERAELLAGPEEGAEVWYSYYEAPTLVFPFQGVK